MPILAQESSLALSVSPPIFEIVIKPGESMTQKFSITNSSSPIDLTAKLTDYDEQSPSLDKTTDDWVHIDSLDSSFTLPTNSEKELTLTISPPENINEGEYNKVLLISSVPQTIVEGTGSHIVGHIGAVILITVSKTGAVSHLAKILEFNLPFIQDSFSPLSASILLQNTGTGRIRPSGQILVNGSLGKATYSIIPETLFSGNKKILTTDASNQEKGRIKSLYIPGFYIGKYDVSVTINLGNTRSKLIQTRSIFALPWKALLVTSIVTLGLLIYVKKHKKPTSSVS